MVGLFVLYGPPSRLISVAVLILLRESLQLIVYYFVSFNRCMLNSNRSLFYGEKEENNTIPVCGDIIIGRCPVLA